jgi:hypothetical protein
LCRVKCMNLMYIINFKVFGYSHPFRRKMQTKVKVLKENMVAMWCFLPCVFGPYVLCAPAFLTLSWISRAKKCKWQHLFRGALYTS